MSSDGESSDDEHRSVTLQIQLEDRSTISVQTELDLTVEEFRQVLADRTGIPSDLQCLVYKGSILRDSKTLRNYVLDPNKAIHLVHRVTSAPSTSSGSMSGRSTPRSPRETCGLDAALRSFNEPQARLLVEHPYCTANIIERIPSLRLQEDIATIEIYIAMYLYYFEINRRMAIVKAYIMENIKVHSEGSCKLNSVYAGHQGISLRTEENQLSLLLLGLNLGGTPGSGPESSNANRLESALNTDPLPNPWAANSYRATIWPLRGTIGAIDTIMRTLFSDVTLLRHSMEQGELIDRAVAEVLVGNSASHDQSSSLSSAAAALDAYFNPIERKVHALQNVTDYDSSRSSSGGSDDFAPKEAVSVAQLASQLAQMEEMGFMDRQENLRALLESGGDVQKAVKRLLEKQNLDGG